MTVSIYQREAELEANCDECGASITESDKVFCSDCHVVDTAEYADWLRDLAYDLRDAKVDERFVRRVLEKLDSLD